MKQLFTFLLLPLLAINASFEPVYKPPDYLISDIRIVCNGSITEERYCTDQASMQRILQYLRMIEFCDEIDEAAPQDTSPVYEIILTHSTGRVTVYRQISRCYLSKNGGRWHRLDPEQGQLLSVLYHGLPTRS